MSEQSQAAPPPDTNGYAEPEIKRYKLRRKVFKFILEDEDNADRAYELRGMNGEERDRWLEKQNERMTGGRNPRVKNLRGAFADLIACCCYDAAGGRVPPEMIQKWPADVQMDLFRRCQEMSGLNPQAEEDAKNA